MIYSTPDISQKEQEQDQGDDDESIVEYDAFNDYLSIEESDEEETPEQSFVSFHGNFRHLNSMVLEESKAQAPEASFDTHPSKRADHGFFLIKA